MKRIIIAICIIACSLSTQAQNQIFSKYATIDGVDFVCINKAMFGLGTKMISVAGGSEDLSKLGSLDKMLIISSDNDGGKKDYEVLMTSHSSGGDNMFIFTNKRKPHELIIGTIGKDDSSMVVVVGDFSKEDISNFLNQ